MKKLYVKDYKKLDFNITDIHLYVDLTEEDCTTVTATSKVRSLNDKAKDLVLDGHSMELLSVKVNGSPAEYALESHHLTLKNVPSEFEMEIITRKEPHNNKSFEGLYKSNGMYCTQCEAHGFQKITYFLDRPDNMSLFKTTIKADEKKYPVLLSNGNLISQKKLEGGFHEVTWEDPFKKPSYLFALVAGDLDMASDSFTTRSGKNVDLKIYVNKGRLDRTEFALKCLKSAMKWDEDVYDLEYDLNLFMIVAVDDFNMGAMENKGLNIFNSQFVLANDKVATDLIYERIDSIIAHEYFHNWTGNRVTCRDWFQLSLKEGLTVYRDQEYSADMTSRAVKRIDDIQALRAHQFAEDAGPTAHPVRPESAVSVDNFYTPTIYEKGAEIIRMYEALLTKQGFKKGMDYYFEQFDGQAVTIDDFAHSMSAANNDFDFTQFKLWYDQSGTPEVQVSTEYDPAKKHYTITLTQSCPATPGQPTKKPFLIPIKMGLLDSQGESLNLYLNGKDLGKETTLILTSESESFTFSDVKETPVPSLLRDFSAPIRLNLELSKKDQFLLVSKDPNFFQRWESFQIVAKELLLKLIQNPDNHNEILDNNKELIEALKSNLINPTDPAFVAKLMELPSIFYLEQFIKEIEPLSVFSSYDSLNKFIGKALESDLLKTYNELHTTDYQYEISSVGRRSLKNRCLYYLTKTNKETYFDLAHKQFNECENMTDQVAALSALNHFETPQKEKAYDEFYKKWCKDPVVFNTYLRLRSADDVDSVFDWVKNTRFKDSHYHCDNPNQISSLLGPFLKITPQFHKNYKESYEFITDEILRIDIINPQVASSLAKAFNLWQKYKEPYKTEMHKCLKRVKNTEGLSKNTYEIVSQALKS